MKKDYNCNMHKEILVFNDVLKQIKNQLNISNDKLMNILKCNQPLLSLYLNNKRNVTYSKAILLIEYLTKKGVNIYDFIFKNDDKYFYHGSRTGVIGDITINKCNRLTSDFGRAFYIGESLKQSSTFISSFPVDKSRVYYLDVNLNNLSMIDLTPTNSDDYRWLLCVAYHRGFIDGDKYSELVKAIKSLIKGVDIVKGPIADDKMTSVMERFLRNEITHKQLMKCLLKMKLGNQYAFKNDKAIKHINMIKEVRLDETMRKIIDNHHFKEHIETLMYVNSLITSKDIVGKTFDQIIMEISKRKWKI